MRHGKTAVQNPYGTWKLVLCAYKAGGFLLGNGLEGGQVRRREVERVKEGEIEWSLLLAIRKTRLFSWTFIF